MAIVLVHGGWQGAAAFDQVRMFLQAQGHAAFAEDLPGSGKSAQSPRSYSERPLNRNAFATEPSPIAGITQEQRTRTVISLVERTVHDTGGPVVLFGHSINGPTISEVAEALPDRLSAVVYLAAVLIPPGKTLDEVSQHPTFSNASVKKLYLADPPKVGAFRIDFKSEDPDYRAQLKKTFYADLVDDDLSQALDGFCSDEPYGVSLVPAKVTRERFGRVRRHYIRTLHDHLLDPASQDFMISEMDQAMGNRTTITNLGSSHSPFLSQPALLAEMITQIAARVGSRYSQT